MRDYSTTYQPHHCFPKLSQEPLSHRSEGRPPRCPNAPSSTRGIPPLFVSPQRQQLLKSVPMIHERHRDWNSPSILQLIVSIQSNVKCIFHSKPLLSLKPPKVIVITLSSVRFHRASNIGNCRFLQHFRFFFLSEHQTASQLSFRVNKMCEVWLIYVEIETSLCIKVLARCATINS